jgi:hypothetical protein
MRAALLVLAGCNVVFPLTAQPDAAVFDASPCLITHDEDGDGIDDSCDLCPVTFDDGRNVTEMIKGLPPDGVADACDPDQDHSGDRILLFDPFTTTTTNWTTDPVIVSSDLAQLPDGASLTSVMTYAPTTLEVLMNVEIAPQQASVTLGDAACTVTAAPCPGKTSDGCASIVTSAGASSAPLVGPEILHRVAMIFMPGVFACAFEAGSQITIAEPATVLASGTLTIGSSGGQGLTIHSVAIYGH